MFDENGWIWPKLWGVVEGEDGKLYPCTKEEYEEKVKNEVKS